MRFLIKMFTKKGGKPGKKRSEKDEFSLVYDKDENVVLQNHKHKGILTVVSTILGDGTVEHLLAAIRSCGVDNLLIEISADEVPILDGSCAPIVEIIKQAGISSQRVPRFGIRIERRIEVRQGERFAILEPSSVPRI